MENKNSGGDKSPPKIIDLIKSYLELKVEYYKLSFTEKTALLIGWLVLMFFLGILSLAVLLLIILLIYNLLLQWIGTPWIVTLIEIGFIGLLATILWLGKKKLIIHPVSNMIVRVLLDSDDDKNEKED